MAESEKDTEDAYEACWHEQAYLWPELVPKWIETALNEPRVSTISIGTQTEKELLNKMLEEVNLLCSEEELLEQDHARSMAKKCKALLELFISRSEEPITDAAPLNLAVLFYEYGRLTMPSSRLIHESAR